MSFTDHIYTVLCIESTGIFKHRDSIIELALVQIDSRGEVLRNYETLIKPAMSLDNMRTSSGGLSAAELAHAPTFGHVAGDILDIIRGTILVAHSAELELGFLQEEFKRVDLPLPENLPSICTLKLAYTFGPSDRRLAYCCRHFGLSAQSGSAASSARACAALFARYIEMAQDDGYKDFGELGFDLTEVALPLAEPLSMSFTRRDADMLQALEESLPPSLRDLPQANTCAAARYFNKLDHLLALRDERLELSASDASDLIDLALACGLSPLQVETLHQKYLRDLVRVAYLDGPPPERQAEHLQDAARALGMARHEVDQIVEQALSTPQSAWGIYREAQERLSGKKVCFLGKLSASVSGARLSLEEAFDAAQEHGLIPVEEVTRGLDYLVCDSQTFQSETAESARSRGTEVLAEPIFWKMLGVKVD